MTVVLGEVSCLHCVSIYLPVSECNMLSVVGPPTTEDGETTQPNPSDNAINANNSP